MKLKLDLHTHCGEATGCRGSGGRRDPNQKVVREIVEAVQARGLDGIAITDHDDHSFAYHVKAIVDRDFAGQIMIIPGSERHCRLGHVVELYLPGEITFRFLAHPGSIVRHLLEESDNFHGIELDNNGHRIDKQVAREAAEKHDLLLLSNSDAHDLCDIGHYYNEISLEELVARATALPVRM